MITTLKKHGNGKAIVIPKAILELLNFTDKTQFGIETDGVELTIKSINGNGEKIMSAWEKVQKKYDKNLKSLANR